MPFSTPVIERLFASIDESNCKSNFFNHPLQCQTRVCGSMISTGDPLVVQLGVIAEVHEQAEAEAPPPPFV